MVHSETPLNSSKKVRVAVITLDIPTVSKNEFIWSRTMTRSIPVPVPTVRRHFCRLGNGKPTLSMQSGCTNVKNVVTRLALVRCDGVIITRYTSTI